MGSLHLQPQQCTSLPLTQHSPRSSEKKTCPFLRNQLEFKYSEIMVLFTGKFKRTEEEKYEDFLSALGVNLINRKGRRMSLSTVSSLIRASLLNTFVEMLSQSNSLLVSDQSLLQFLSKFILLDFEI